MAWRILGSTNAHGYMLLLRLLLLLRTTSTCGITHAALAAALLGPRYQSPFGAFQPPQDLREPTVTYNQGRGRAAVTSWYSSNFAESHRDLALELVRLAGHDGWILELGSFIGSSAVTLGNAVRKVGSATPIVCMDTWLGDVNMWNVKGRMLGPQGLSGEPRLYEQFMTNVRAANLSDIVIPVRAPAMVGLRYLDTMIRSGKITAPSIIYLDTAHEYPETVLEMQVAWSILGPGGLLTGDDYDKFWPQLQQSVNEFVTLRPLSEFEDPYIWAARWPVHKRRRMKLVGLVKEPSRAARLLPLMIKEPKQWLLKKAATTTASAGSPAVASTSVTSVTSGPRSLEGMKPAVRCCLAGWADPMPHQILGKAWCSKFGQVSSRLDAVGVNRSADCAASARRRAWYTECLPRGHPLQQRACSAASKTSCPVYFACRGPIYEVGGQLSGAPDKISKAGGFT